MNEKPRPLQGGTGTRFRSFRAETFYRSATELQTYEEIPFAGSSITRTLKDRVLKLRNLSACPAGAFMMIATPSKEEKVLE